MARPSKLTPELQAHFCALLRAGNTIEVAAVASGVGVSTYYSWVARADQGRVSDKPYAEFSAAVDQAHAEAESILVTRVAQAAAKGSWQAAAWMLERRNPERWSKASERKHLHGDDDSEREAADPFAGLDAASDELAKRRKPAA